MKTNWQDPVTSEIFSSNISGLQEAVGKIEDSIGLKTTAETGITLSEVYVTSTDRYRIFQVAEGKRNWVASPAPVIKKNSAEITTGFAIDYGGGAIVLETPALSTDEFTAGFTRTNSVSDVNTHLADYEYQTPTIVGTQIQLQKQSDTNILKFKLTADLTGGAITISLDAGATSKPLVDIDGVSVTELDKGFVEVVENAVNFTYAPKGGKSIKGLIITPSTVNQAIPKGVHDGLGYVEGSANLISENIKSGINIFGAIGNLESLRYASGYTGIVPYNSSINVYLPFSANLVIAMKCSSTGQVSSYTNGEALILCRNWFGNLSQRNGDFEYMYFDGTYSIRIYNNNTHDGQYWRWWAFGS